MTQQHSRPHSLRVALLAIVAGGLLAAGPAEGPVILMTDGPVQIGSGEPPIWRDARAGDRLAPGDAVRTRRGGRAEVQLRTGTVRLFENSLLRLPAGLPASGQSERVRMEHGSSIFDVLRRSVEDLFEVETPEVAVMVKGTRFSVSVADGQTNVAVYRGLVGVRHRVETLEAEVLVRAGFAVAGTPEGAFELVVNPLDDPWQGWSAERAPLIPRAALEPALGRARALAVQEADGELGHWMLERHPELRSRMLRRRGRREVSDPGPLVDSQTTIDDNKVEDPDLISPDGVQLQPATDPVLDAEALATIGIQEQFTETLVTSSSGLGGWDVTRMTSGGPNTVQVTAPSGTFASYDKTQLDWIISTNSTALFYPELDSAISKAGIAPYLVLPERPSGTENLSEDELLPLINRDSMIGVSKATTPESSND